MISDHPNHPELPNSCHGQEGFGQGVSQANVDLFRKKEKEMRMGEVTREEHQCAALPRGLLRTLGRNWMETEA